MRFHIITAASIKMTAFWDDGSSKHLYFYETTRRNIPEGAHLQPVNNSSAGQQPLTQQIGHSVT
jgi:hypothetical protein